MHVRVFALLALLAGSCAAATPVLAAGDPALAGLDASFSSDDAKVNGTTIHYVRGGHGPALILLHAFPEDWMEYRSIMPRLAKRFTVVAPDLRGIGLSAPAASGFDTTTLAEDIYQLAGALKLDHSYVVGHDIGGLVAYALVRNHPQALRGAMIVEAPMPGINGWDQAMHGPGTWHVGFMQAPNHLAEKLLAGRIADYLGYFFQIGKFSPEAEAHYIQAYSAPSQLHALLEMYRAFPQDVTLNAAHHERNDVPIVFAHGDKSPFLKMTPVFVQGLHDAGFTHVETASIPGAVHYVMDDAPDATAAVIEKYAGTH